MSTLILLRHGQAAFGADAYDQLSELGHAQALATGAWLGERAGPLAAVWHGPRRRHADTASGVLAGAGRAFDAVAVAGLDEFGEGEDVLRAAEALFGGPMLGDGAPPRDEQLRCYDRAIAAWAAGDADMPGRMPYTQFRAAVRTWLDALVGTPGRPGGRTELAVTSAGVVAAVVCDVLELPDPHWHRLLRMIGNCSVTEIAFSGSRRGLSSFNATGHLPARLATTI
ncbi:histidine phosphatase family protein (plasmid) [Thauera butanivorans]|uniref:histidine phosphatase family protein n=1 Tax=Thauera butanivorans TaxID=86174 RepID=UPI003AB47899